jgi:NADPH:quinone reductase-like Zn-dependent oxidoreductase
MFARTLSLGKKVFFRPMGLRSTRTKIRDLRFLVDLIESGQLRPVIDRVFPFEQIAAARDYVKNAPKKGNVAIVLVP